MIARELAIRDGHESQRKASYFYREECMNLFNQFYQSILEEKVKLNPVIRSNKYDLHRWGTGNRYLEISEK